MLRRLSGAGALTLLLAAVALVAWPLLRPPDGRLKLTVLDIGQGDGIVVETPDGRALASGQTREVDVNFEFLNFEHARVDSEYRFQGKREKEAPLFFRFVKTTRNVSGAFDDGNWHGTEEKLFRLWRVD